ncbi:LacI family DNA-binding transcriptional regulator (plasmid) [Agrobacterium deltaense]|uniref:LacI family DNA-binding transcriptional regulator n=1 Tax=Agrobacterium deltaense TaxID=1183412 RepID=UPI003D975210
MKGSRSDIQPTIDDVAHAAGVSRATAARVLGDYGKVTSGTRDLVLQAARKLAYHPNQVARTVATGRSQTIGVVIADIETHCSAQAIRAMTDTAIANDFAVMLAITDDDVELERHAVYSLLAKRVDGLIVSPASSVETDHLQAAKNMNCPVVLFDRRAPALEVDTFAVENFSAAYEAATFLIEKNHRRIALVSKGLCDRETQQLLSPTRERIDGYLAALDDAGIRDASLIVDGGGDATKLSQHVRSLCEAPDSPTAFLATESSVGFMLLRIFQEMKLSIPEDISFICVDDSGWAAAVALTVVAAPMGELSSAATETLIARLRDRVKEPPREIFYTAKLIERSSVAKALKTPTVAQRTENPAHEPRDA